ncbi:HEPN domain protein [Carboxydocella sp. ULO1]|nr:HEPN domain protein [Carboxydocella sp. ULO1]
MAELLPGVYASAFFEYELECLTEWCVESRYPGDFPEATKEDAILAINIDEAVYNLV